MADLLQYFGAAYVINLPERVDRLKSAKREFARAGWIVGDGGVKIHAPRRFDDAAGFPSKQSRSCFHSHSECIREARRLGKDSVLVMEDDLALPSSIRILTRSIISQLESTPWDFVYLGHEYLNGNPSDEIARANGRTRDVKFRPLTGPIYAAHFYVVHSRIFGRLLDQLDRLATKSDAEFGPMPIDGAFDIFRRRNPDVRTLMATPKLGWQRPSRSDSHPSSFDSIRLLRPAIHVLRNMKYLASRWRV